MDKRVYDNYVIQVAKHGSMTRAAAALGVSQPALSSGISALEKELGITIFDRKKNPISLTDEGRIYCDYLARIAVLDEDLGIRLKSLKSDFDDSLRIGAPVAYMDALVSDLIVEISQEHPEYDISLKSAQMSELIEMASKGDINCFISTSDNLPGNIVAEEIKREKLFLCVPESLEVNAELQSQIDSNGSIQDYSCLSNCSFVLLEKEQPLQEQIDEFLSANELKLKSKLTVNQVSTAVNLAYRGVGACFASEDAIANMKNSGKLCIYPLSDKISGRSIYIAYDKELLMPEACRSFINQIKK